MVSILLHPIGTLKCLCEQYVELEFLPDVINDLDVDFSANPAAAASYMNDQRNRRKVQEHTKKLQVNLINPLREGKRLLVLDIDYSKVWTQDNHIMGTQSADSDSGYQASDVWCSPTARMCSTWATRVLGGSLPIL